MTHTDDIVSSLIIFSVILAPKYHTRIKGPSALGHTHQASFRIGLHTSSVFPHWVSYIRRLSALRHASSVFPHSDTRIRRLSAFGQTVISADKGPSCTTYNLHMYNLYVGTVTSFNSQYVHPGHYLASLGQYKIVYSLCIDHILHLYSTFVLHIVSVQPHILSVQPRLERIQP